MVWKRMVKGRIPVREPSQIGLGVEGGISRHKKQVCRVFL